MLDFPWRTVREKRSVTVSHFANGWLEYDPFLLGQTAYFQGRTVCWDRSRVGNEINDQPQPSAA